MAASRQAQTVIAPLQLGSGAGQAGIPAEVFPAACSESRPGSWPSAPSPCARVWEAV